MDHVHWFGIATQQLFSSLVGHEQVQDEGGFAHCLQHQAQSGFREVQCGVQTHQDSGFKVSKHQASQSQKLWVDNSVGVAGLVAIFQQHLSLSNLSDMARESRLAWVNVLLQNFSSIQHQLLSQVHQGVVQDQLTNGIFHDAEQSGGIQHQIFGLCVYQGSHIWPWRLTGFFQSAEQSGTHWDNIACVCSQYFPSIHVVHHLLTRFDCKFLTKPAAVEGVPHVIVW